MISVGRIGPAAAGLVRILALAGRGDNDDASSPTPVTTPSPGARRTGLLRERHRVRIGADDQHARAGVQLTGGAAFGTGSDGTFTIPNVANGSYTLTIRKAGFNSTTIPVTVAGANVTGLTANLQPVARIVDVIQDRSTSRNRNECGNSRACEVVQIASHNNGESRFFVAWNNTADELDLEYWCNGVRVARSELNGIGADEVKPAIVAGQTCDLRIINTTNTTFAYTLYLTYPH